MKENNHNMLICRFPILVFLVLVSTVALGRILSFIKINSVFTTPFFSIENLQFCELKYHFLCRLLVHTSLTYYLLIYLKKYFIISWSLTTLPRKINEFKTQEKFLFLSYARIMSKVRNISVWMFFIATMESLTTFS